MMKSLVLPETESYGQENNLKSDCVYICMCIYVHSL